jgi:hypothetical protein
MKTICLFDTAVISRNTGDQVIMEAVRKELLAIFPKDLYVNVPTHDFLNLFSYHLLKKCHLKFVGGSNLLNSNMPFFNQWIITPIDVLFMKEPILMGAGWWQYQGKPNAYTAFLYKNILSKQHIHAVRDEYTKQQLASIGITNVLNTACPSMWQLTPEHCAKIPHKKSSEVVVTLTVTHKKEAGDKELIKLLRQEYEKVYFWPQQPEDYEYILSVGGEENEILPANLEGYDEFLSTHKVDYIGTRLHGGIRALQKQKRSLILAIDNRAVEISKDTHLPVVQRSAQAEIKEWINSNYVTQITLPTQTIEKWKSQFK